MEERNVMNFHPQICLNCRSWLKDSTICDVCQHDNSLYADFYALCNSLEDELGQGVNVFTYERKLQALVTRELRHGWLPDLLAIISALVLGILTNASYDLIKHWILTKRAEYKQNFSEPFEYEGTIEVLLDFLIENHDQISALKISDDKIDMAFRKRLEDLKTQIEEQSIGAE
ncbi:MAG: hypothetical protein H6669_07240 [Ardenticatenaceae bacterium]|nr:hypothetical protein [Ardenticatenaceae bacterium]